MSYIRTCIAFWLSVQQKGIYTEYLVIKKETLSPKSPKFPFSLRFFPSTVLSERFHFCTHQLFSVFIILRGKFMRGRLKLILWRMPDV